MPRLDTDLNDMPEPGEESALQLSQYYNNLTVRPQYEIARDMKQILEILNGLKDHEPALSEPLALWYRMCKDYTTFTE